MNYERKRCEKWRETFQKGRKVAAFSRAIKPNVCCKIGFTSKLIKLHEKCKRAFKVHLSTEGARLCLNGSRQIFKPKNIEVCIYEA